MFDFLKTFHSHNRHLILLLLVIAIALSLFGLLTKKKWSKANQISALLAMVISDIQFLIGLVLYVAYSPFGLKAFSNENINVMKDKAVREIAVEHLVLMLAAWILVHIGYAKMKKASNKFRVTSIYYSIALVLILLGIPWDRLA